MRSVPLGALSLLLLAAIAAGQELTQKDVDVSYLEQELGIKLKSFAVRQPTKEEFLQTPREVPTGLGVFRVLPKVHFLFTLEKDLANPKILQDTLGQGKASGDRSLYAYFVDGDNVAFAKTELSPGDRQVPRVALQGEVAGQKGEAFRWIVALPGEDLKKAKRVIIRPSPLNAP